MFLNSDLMQIFEAGLVLEIYIMKAPNDAKVRELLL